MEEPFPVGPGPVDDKGLPLNRLFGNKPPKSAVITVVPVISHDEVMFFRNGNGTEAIAIAGVVTLHAPAGVITVLVIERSAVHINSAVNDLDLVARQADNTFDEILALIHRVDKDNHVIPVGLVDRDEGVAGKGHFYPVDEFVYKNVVPDKEGGFHGPGGDLECLNHEGSDEQG